MKKVALITGSYKGIGFENSQTTRSERFYCHRIGTQREKAEEAAEKLKDENIEAYSIKLDVTDEKEVDKAYKYIHDKFGQLDVLVNNAGIQLDNDSFADSNSVETVSHKILKETSKAISLVLWVSRKSYFL